eukprot:SAG11_NODE_8719_length_983_cov_1.811086_2_plen_85_part_00
MAIEFERDPQGDGKTDDSAALQRAVNSHVEVFLPHGIYIIANAVTLGTRVPAHEVLLNCTGLRLALSYVWGSRRQNLRPIWRGV